MNGSVSLETDLPTGFKLNRLLGVETSDQLEELIGRVLHEPLRNFLNRPSKAIRAELVKIAFLLCSDRDQTLSQQDEDLCEKAAHLLELIHAGSLVVDDIQDSSLNRRGGLTLHREYGLPIALNAGNWLYFWPLREAQALPLSAEVRLRILEACHLTMLRAHYGQALDVGVAIDTVERERIAEVCRLARSLKSGALMALAARVGGLLANADEERLEVIESFGSGFGLALQMFDDIGNLRSSRDIEKRFEDLRLRRASYLWEVASEKLSPTDFVRFVELSGCLPEATEEFVEFLELTQLEFAARREAQDFLKNVLSGLRKQNIFSQHQRALDLADELAHRLVGGYD